MKISGIKYSNIESVYPGTSLILMTLINDRFVDKFHSGVFISTRIILLKYSRDIASICTCYYRPYNPKIIKL